MAITAAEQYAIELLNRARLDPAGEARRHGMALNEGIGAGSISMQAKQVLAPNALLDKAATQHGQWMIDTDTFSHYRGVEGSKYYLPGDRMAVAGYNFAGASGWSENIDLFSITSSLEATIRDHHARWLGSTSGHREAMFGENSREIGYAHVTGITKATMSRSGCRTTPIQVPGRLSLASPTPTATRITSTPSAKGALASR